MDKTQSILSDENSEEIITNEDDNEIRENRKKYKRHVGPHDNGGLQRTISTGIVKKKIFFSLFLFSIKFYFF